MFLFLLILIAVRCCIDKHLMGGDPKQKLATRESRNDKNYLTAYLWGVHGRTSE